MSNRPQSGTIVDVSRCEAQVLGSLIERKNKKVKILSLRPIDVANKISPNSEHPASWASVYLKRLFVKGLLENVGTANRGIYKLNGNGKATLRNLGRKSKKI